MYPLKKLFVCKSWVMQLVIYIFIGIIDFLHTFTRTTTFLTGFPRKGNRTAYGLAYDSAKVKAWYVAPKVTGCVPVKRFAFEWAKKVVQEDISSGNYVLPWVTNIIGMFVSLASPHMKGD